MNGNEMMEELGHWRRAFHPVTEPAEALENMFALRTAQQVLEEQLKEERRRSDVLLHQLAQKDHELHELKVHMHELKEAARPSSVQVQQLLLDPAVNREFTRMKDDLASSARRLKEAQDELEAARFTQESKAGRMLIAKCRTLQEENEEIFGEMSEGRVKRLEHEVALLKDYVGELRRCCGEYHGSAVSMEDELEAHQQAIFSLKRQLRQN